MTCGVSKRRVRCRDYPIAVLPCCCGGLRWTVTHEFCGSGINEEFCRGATGFGGVAPWIGAKMGDEPSVVRLMDAKAVVTFEKCSPTSPCVPRRRT